VEGREHDREVTNARERKADAALALRIAGMDWPDIAKAVGYPTGRMALVAVEKSLQRNLDIQDKRVLRQVAQGRLDSLLRSVCTKAHTPTDPEHLMAVGKAKEIVDRSIKLLGLDAPTEITVSSPSQRDLDEWVARVTSSNIPAVLEYDVIEGEVIEGDEVV